MAEDDKKEVKIIVTKPKITNERFSASDETKYMLPDRKRFTNNPLLSIFLFIFGLTIIGLGLKDLGRIVLKLIESIFHK